MFGVIVLADGDAEPLQRLLRSREMKRVGIDQGAVEIEQKGAQAIQFCWIWRQKFVPRVTAPARQE